MKITKKQAEKAIKDLENGEEGSFLTAIIILMKMQIAILWPERLSNLKTDPTKLGKDDILIG